MHRPTRREFLRSASVAGLGWVLTAAPHARAVEPFRRRGNARLLLSLAAYSFRDSFPKANAPDAGPEAARLDMFGFIDFCADHGCDAAEVTSYYFPPAVSDEYLLRLRRHAFLRGIALSGTAVGNDFTRREPEQQEKEIAGVKGWIDRAAILGAPHIRIFAGSGSGQPPADAKKRCIDAIQECAEHAAKKGIFLGLENHGGIVAEAEDLLEIVRAVRSAWVGINLDTGNFHSEDPYADLARCAPYAVNVQFKVEIQRRGHPKEPGDFAKIVEMLRAVKYQGYVALEYEAAADAWVAVPDVLGKMRGLLQGR